MLSFPRIGQAVRVRYNAKMRGYMPLHDAVGIVTGRSRGRPRNHEIEIAQELYIIPCGNLFPA